MEVIAYFGGGAFRSVTLVGKFSGLEREDLVDDEDKLERKLNKEKNNNKNVIGIIIAAKDITVILYKNLNLYYVRWGKERVTDMRIRGEYTFTNQESCL